MIISSHRHYLCFYSKWSREEGGEEIASYIVVVIIIAIASLKPAF
jgi:hypothetical protein